MPETRACTCQSEVAAHTSAAVLTRKLRCLCPERCLASRALAVCEPGSPDRLSSAERHASITCQTAAPFILPMSRSFGLKDSGSEDELNCDALPGTRARDLACRFLSEIRCTALSRAGCRALQAAIWRTCLQARKLSATVGALCLEGATLQPQNFACQRPDYVSVLTVQLLRVAARPSC